MGSYSVNLVVPSEVTPGETFTTNIGLCCDGSTDCPQVDVYLWIAEVGGQVVEVLWNGVSTTLGAGTCAPTDFFEKQTSIDAEGDYRLVAQIGSSQYAQSFTVASSSNGGGTDPQGTYSASLIAPDTTTVDTTFTVDAELCCEGGDCPNTDVFMYLKDVDGNVVEVLWNGVNVTFADGECSPSGFLETDVTVSEQGVYVLEIVAGTETVTKSIMIEDPATDDPVEPPEPPLEPWGAVAVGAGVLWWLSRRM